MNLDQAKLVAFANEYEAFQNKKKDLAADLKDYVADFCDENDIKKKKPLIDSVKLYLKWKADRTKFIDEANSLDEFLDVLTGEKCIEQISEEEARA